MGSPLDYSKVNNKVQSLSLRACLPIEKVVYNYATRQPLKVSLAVALKLINPLLLDIRREKKNCLGYNMNK